MVVAQGLLDRRMSGHTPQTGGDRCIELWHAEAAQFIEACASSATAAKDTIVILGGSTLPGR